MHEVHVAVIGTGFAGLAMAIRMKQRGITDFVLLERAQEVGGTWRDNTYPGAACDVPSHLYSFSFAPNPDWTRSFSPQPEIWRYLRRTARDQGVYPHIRFGHDVERADWDEQRGRWIVRTSQATFAAKVLVSGMGPLCEPQLPDIKGLDTFQGNAFHSARWDHEHDFAGKRVAVIGTGASAIQFVPKIQPEVAELHLFQRTAPWVMPRRDRPITAIERALFRAFPPLQRLVRAAIYWGRESYVVGFTKQPKILRMGERFAKKNLFRAIKDKELRKKLLPAFAMGCKRVLISNDYYPALAQSNVDVVTDRITEVRANSVVTADGTERPVDTIIYGTGFHATDPPAMEKVYGKGGVRLGEAWREGMEAYKGTTIAGFPNLFMLVGPNTGLGHNSIVFMIESQVNYVMDALKVLGRKEVVDIDPRVDRVQKFNDRVQKQMQGTVWLTGGCESWYLDQKGRNTTLWPTFTWTYRQLTRKFDAHAYSIRLRATTDVTALNPADKAVR
ncbi:MULTISPECIES: NAD(P)/FAD-dependent oxidoreductase [unclassified Crossiella]|uniref:flavin-containing monooxygenase n=1 Tax=unclassified Crossiella TaxID=2620835 RepID=UPI001FFECE7A|nr:MULTISPECIES: NAD(P)/FAD-dependent oxidoreductase [unclassified Crossiella]MCK2243364.1 NAD(P)/FAD-dependent oxidoreductase [Crossiella sp. S99.2]MCK2254167.1 NAD(P)/FAD-dependent oxidoreductase [Crossiella sp. S99.1]